MKVRTLNRHEEHSIVLLHGLFTNSGFWLPYLRHLKGYCVHLVDLSYETLINEKHEFDNWLSHKIADKQMICLIGHSFGATFLLSIANNNIPKVGINPAHMGLRREASFVRHVSCRYKLDESKVNNYLRKVYNWVDNIDFINRKFEELYVSDNDEFFDYSMLVNDQKICIDGDHFNINKVFDLLIINLRTKGNNYVDR